MIHRMNFANGRISCPKQVGSTAAAPRNRTARQPPACDFAEAGVWEALEGGWQCLHGCFCQSGVSIEWHDFACTAPFDWARSFHPDSIELCLNVSGRARLDRGPDSALFGAGTVGFYWTAGGRLAAWRLPGERHRFLTVEYAMGFLARHLRGQEAGLSAVLRRALQSQPDGRTISPISSMTVRLREALADLRQPPVIGTARNVWFQSKALELMAECFFNPEAPRESPNPRRQTVANERIERTVQILGQRLAEAPSLKELGRLVGCSPYHLSRTFSREMGMTIPQYLREIRMKRAAELLRSGRFNVTEAAVEVGYSSLSHFSHAFCETMGCCPGLYPFGQRLRLPRSLPATATNRQESAT